MLGIETVKVLLEALLARLARVDRAADPGHAAVHARVPKETGPDQRVPVIVRAMTLKLSQSLPCRLNFCSSVTMTMCSLPCHDRDSRVPGGGPFDPAASSQSLRWVDLVMPPTALDCSAWASASRNKPALIFRAELFHTPDPGDRQFLELHGLESGQRGR